MQLLTQLYRKMFGKPSGEALWWDVVLLKWVSFGIMVSHLPNFRKKAAEWQKTFRGKYFFIVKWILSFVSGISKSSVKSQNRKSLNWQESIQNSDNQMKEYSFLEQFYNVNYLYNKFWSRSCSSNSIPLLYKNATFSKPVLSLILMTKDKSLLL